MDRYTLDYRIVTPASGRVGRSGVDAAARVHQHPASDVHGLQDQLDALQSADAALTLAIDALADRILVNEDGEVLTGGGNVLITEA